MAIEKFKFLGGKIAVQHSFDIGLCTYRSSDPGTLSQSWVFGITGFQYQDPGTNPKIGLGFILFPNKISGSVK